MIISVKRNFLELKNINDLIKKDKPEENYSVKEAKQYLESKGIPVRT